MIRREEVIGDCRLILGDCLDIIPTLDRVDAVVTDPPYGVTAQEWDTVIDFERLWSMYWTICPNGAVVMMSSQPFTTKLISSQFEHFKYCWYWKKNFSTNFLHAKRQPLRNVEDICVFMKGSSHYNPIKTHGHLPTQSAKGSSKGKLWHGDNERNYQGGETDRYPTQVLEFDAVNPKSRHHSNEKPVSLMEYLIRTYTSEANIVLDNAMGSGTTGVACRNTGRKFIGIEREPSHFETACRRIEEAYKQPDMLIEMAKPMAPKQENLFGEA